MANATEFDAQVSRLIDADDAAGMLKLLAESGSGGDEFTYVSTGERCRLLFVAIHRGWTEVALHLIQHGADLKKRHMGRTPLIDACAHQNHPVIDALVVRGVDLNAKASKGEGETDDTALMEAATQGDLWAVRRLIRAGADVNALNCHRQSAVCTVLVPVPNANRAAVVDELLQAGCRLVGIELHLPICRRDVAMTRRLLEHGGPLDEPFTYNEYAGPKKGETPLTSAVRLQHTDLVDAPEFDTLLPTGEQRVEVTRMLLASGADPNAPGPKGVTPLMLAVSQRDPRVARMLLDAGADPDYVPAKTKGMSPVALAQKHGLEEMSGLLRSPRA